MKFRTINISIFRLRMNRSASEIIETGRDLIEAKRHLGHGNFLPWIEKEFGMSDRTARTFMQVAETFKSETVSDLPPTVLYALAAPSTPEPVREEVMARAKALAARGSPSRQLKP